MNYYPFHIGDYVSATRHLSWDEDAAYRRLLDTYYTNEKPLPADVPKVCRLVLATTDAQRAAVQTVLEEFFTLTEDGWVNARADEEIAAMREKVQATEEKDGHEKTRKERYRERRAFLFAFLRERDVVPPYDIGMKQLQEQATAKGWTGTFQGVPSVPVPSERGVPSGVPVERSGNVTLDAPGTAIPIPTPTPTPVIPPTGVQGGTPPRPPASFARPGWIPAEPWDEFVAMRKAKGKRSPFTVGAAKGIVAELQRLLSAGNDVGEVLRQSVRNGWSDVYPLKHEGGGDRASGGRAASHRAADWTEAAT